MDKKSHVSRWMETSNFGRAIANRVIRYSVRHYYRVIIAAIVIVLATIEAIHAPRIMQKITGYGVLLFGISLIGRQLLPGRWLPRYYKPRIQFARALIYIVIISLVLAAYTFFRQSTFLWFLYIVPLMIINEHCGTQGLLPAAGAIDLVLIGLGYAGSDLSLFDYFCSSSALLTALLRAFAVLLMGFLLHYLVRGVEARDAALTRYQEMLDALTLNIRSLHNPQAVRALVLNTFQAMHAASCSSIWIVDSQANSLVCVACTSENERCQDCPLANNMAYDASLSLDDDRLPACVARTGHLHFASRADKPPRYLSGALPAPRPFLPHARLELGIPIPDFQPHERSARAVLCLAFDRPMSHDEMRHESNAVREMTHYLIPFLYYASLLEQYQTLQQLLQTITHSLDRDYILDTLLELVTSIFGFDFATVSLVDEVQGIICIVRGRNVPDGWASAGGYALDSHNIRADVIQTGHVEILVGHDERFDRQMWERFGHQDMARIFVPMVVIDPVSGQEKRIGVLEAGYDQHGSGKKEKVSREQVSILQPFVDQAAVAVANARLYEQMQSKAEALTALHHSGQAIQLAIWQPRRLLEEIGHSAKQVLGADIVFLFEYDEESHHADLVFVGGDVWGKGEPSPRLDEGNILDAIIDEREPFYFPDAQHEPRLVGYGGADGRQRRTFTQRQKVVSFAGVPLSSGKKLRGIMCVNYRTRNYFSEDQRRLIELFAQQAAIALENAHLREKERKLIIARQRDTFSRELHHSVSHDLFAVALKARTALHHTDSLHAQVAHELGDILHIAESANRQVGYLISEFSALEPDGEDFRHVMQESVARIRRYYDIDVEVCCDGSSEAKLSPRLHFALSRIVKEALNNAIRHSQCRHIVITCVLCQEKEKELFLEIVDDGIGFDLERALRKEDKFGLGNVQGYARSMGCQLDMQSTPGQGTRIAVRVPLYISSEGSLTCATQMNLG